MKEKKAEKYKAVLIENIFKRSQDNRSKGKTARRKAGKKKKREGHDLNG